MINNIKFFSVETEGLFSNKDRDNLTKRIKSNISETKIEFIAGSEAKVKISYNVVHNDVSFWVTCKVVKSAKIKMEFSKSSVAQETTIKQIKILSFNDIKILYDKTPETYALFERDLRERYDCIRLNQLTKNHSNHASYNHSEDKCETNCPKELQIKNNNFVLSNEAILNLCGKRGEEHQIDLDIFKAILKRSLNNLKKSKSNESKRSLYFKLANEKIINVIFIIDKPNYIVETAYYINNSHILKERFGFSDVQLDHWKKKLVPITI